MQELAAAARIIHALNRDLAGALGLHASSWCIEPLGRGRPPGTAYLVTGQVTGVVLDEDLSDAAGDPGCAA